MVLEPRQVELLVSEINLLKRAVRYLLGATWQTGTVKDRLGNTVEHLASKDPDLSLEAVLEIKTELKKTKGEWILDLDSSSGGKTRL